LEAGTAIYTSLDVVMEFENFLEEAEELETSFGGGGGVRAGGDAVVSSKA
jgi:hypothetical protein